MKNLIGFFLKPQSHRVRFIRKPGKTKELFSRDYGLLIICLCALTMFLIGTTKTSAQNLILNSSFELWLDSMGVRMPFGWYTSEASDSGSAVRTTDAHSGLYALQLNGSDTMAYASTVTYCQAGHNYYFSGWTKSNAFIAGSFIITWLKLSQEPLMDPVIIPILRHTSYYNHTQIVHAPDSAILVNVNVVALPGVTIYVDDVTLRDTVLVGIEEAGSKRYEARMFEVYPNPASSYLAVRGHSDMQYIKIFDVTGKLIKEEKFKRSKVISLDGIKSGVYFLRAMINNKECIKKFVIQR